MKKLRLLKALTALSLFSVFIIAGCKKEVVKPTTLNTVTVTDHPTDSANYLRGYLGGEPVVFEGNTIFYHGYVDPDSAAHNDGGNDDHHDAYYSSGSKWVTLSGAGLTVMNATMEIRSLAVRVFVSPIQASSTNYYNLLGTTTYALSNTMNPGKGAYIAIRDKNGVLWTSAGDQDGSTLTVDTRGPNMLTYTVVSGTINCKMYDSAGHIKQFNNAKYTASLGI